MSDKEKDTKLMNFVKNYKDNLDTYQEGSEELIIPYYMYDSNPVY